MTMDKQPVKYYGDEGPSLKDFLIVLIVAGIIIAFSWVAYYKFHWFH